MKIFARLVGGEWTAEDGGACRRIWPRHGMVRAGTAYARGAWASWIASELAAHNRPLLPTPVLSDHNSSRNSTSTRFKNDQHTGDTLTDALTKLGAIRNASTGEEASGFTGWQQYASAILIWEWVSGYNVPMPPATPNSAGSLAINPKLSEWMMGLPPGFVTDTEGLSRSEVMKILGNGVCPQQMESMIDHLLDEVEGT